MKYVGATNEFSWKNLYRKQLDVSTPTQRELSLFKWFSFFEDQVTVRETHTSYFPIVYWLHDNAVLFAITMSSLKHSF